MYVCADVGVYMYRPITYMCISYDRSDDRDFCCPVDNATPNGGIKRKGKTKRRKEVD